MADAELDIERPGSLLEYLRGTGRVQPGEDVAVRVLAGGVSNRSVLVERPGGRGAWVLKQALAKLRTKADWFSDPARVRREAQGLLWLRELAPAGATTPLVFEDPAHNLLAMEAVPEPHENWKSVLLAGRVEEDHVGQFGRLLGEVHRRGWERRDELAGVFGDRSFFESLRLEPYYLYAAGQEPRAAEFLRKLVETTRTRRLTVVHGDYSPKNVLVHAGRLVLLDHEVIHFGDPAFDLGFGLTHLLSKAHHLPARRDAFAGAARLFWQTYLDQLGPVPWRQGVESHAVRHALGCLLARVAGRSPLEYLDESERARQREAVIRLVPDPPAGVDELVAEFVQGVST